MKIAIIYDMIYPFNIGGLEIRNYEIAKRLIKKGHEVHLYGVKLWEGGDIIKKDGLILHGVCRYKNLYNINGKRTIFEPIKFAVKIFPELMKEKFDIIDNSSLPYLHCFTVALYAKIKKTPLLMTWQLYGGNYWYSYLGYKGFIGKITEKIVVKLTDNHLPASETTKKDLVNAGAKKVFVSYNGVDFKKINSAKRKNSNYDIIFVGRLCHQKNVCLLIESVALLKKDFPKLKIAIIGGGPDRKKLEKLSEKKHRG